MPDESDSDPTIPKHPIGEARGSWLRSREGVVFLVFLAFVAYFLLTEHLAHTIQVLPWAILLLCPVMHFFMHRGHGGGSNRR